MYIAETGRFDALTNGNIYELHLCRETSQYLINCNDLGGQSWINKDKFIIDKLEMLKFLVPTIESYSDKTEFVLTHNLCKDKSEWKRMFMQLSAKNKSSFEINFEEYLQ
jgi:hypothetical protein